MKHAWLALLALALGGCTLPKLVFTQPGPDASDATDIATDVVDMDADAGADAADAGADADATTRDSGTHVVALAAGRYHACAIVGSGLRPPGGRLICWGLNTTGQAGHLPLVAASSPGSVALPTGTVNVAALALGDAHSCGIFGTSSGTQAVYCWGTNGGGQLGAGSASDGGVSVQPQAIATADDGMSLVATPGSAGSPQFGFIAANGNTTCVTFGGTVYCWGDNGSHRITACGADAGCAEPASFATPHAVAPTQTASTFSGLAVGGMNVCAERTGSSMECWGANANGQLGNGRAVSGEVLGPTPIPSVTTVQTTGLALGDDYVCDLWNGTVYCWGSNQLGRTGQATTLGSTTMPTIVNGISGPPTSHTLSAYAQHACVIVANSDIKCWGLNTSGEVGHSDTVGCPNCANVPESVSIGSPGTTQFDLLAAGGNFSCVHVSTDDSVWCWGSDSYGQLGVPSLMQGPLRAVLPAY